jgi:hypothetical protein
LWRRVSAADASFYVLGTLYNAATIKQTKSQNQTKREREKKKKKNKKTQRSLSIELDSKISKKHRDHFRYFSRDDKQRFLDTKPRETNTDFIEIRGRNLFTENRVLWGTTTPS